MSSLVEVLRAIGNGPLLEAEMFPLNNKGKLRVTYNWLYSSLNCDPNDDSSFVWVFSKLNDTQVAISPRDQYAGMTLYASVRDDLNWYVEVQAPYSADWIRAVGRDETLGMQGQDLLMISLTGFNGQYIAVDSEISSHDGHAGYRLRSVGTSDIKSRMWFLGVTRTLQAGINVALKEEVTEDHIRRAFQSSGLSLGEEEIDQVRSWLT